MALPIGANAPDFTLPSTSGSTFSLSKDFRGKVGVLYFYPKDFTAGCTAEACSFRDSFELFRNVNVPIVGISPDDIPTHNRFREAHNLPFHLLSDENKTVSASYDVLAPIVKFVQRVTLLIDTDMKIAAVYQDLFDARAHIDQMIKALNTKTFSRV